MNNNEYIVLTKVYGFTVRIVNLFQHLSSEKKKYILCKQKLKSNTSIGTSAEEAVDGVSKANFKATMGIAYKEARETDYWLRLLHDTGYLEKKPFNSIKSDLTELLKILFTIIKHQTINRLSISNYSLHIINYYL